MELAEIDEKRISGLSIRTTNAKEMNPSMGKIGPLWKEFDEKVEIDYKNGNRVYGVYLERFGDVRYICGFYIYRILCKNQVEY